MSGHTAGPWEWRKFGHGAWALVTVGRGCIIVMDFVRQGMNSAQPRFGRRSESDKGGIMVPADKLEDLDRHPDACLLKAAPDLLAACKAARNLYDHLSLGPLEAAAKYGDSYEPPSEDDMLKVRGDLEAAITKATAEAGKG